MLSNNTIYIFVGIILVLIIFYFILRRSTVKSVGEIKTRKYSDFKKERDQRVLEQKIRVREAQEELEKLRHQEKLRALEQKMEENKSELLKLKRGY